MVACCVSPDASVQKLSPLLQPRRPPSGRSQQRRPRWSERQRSPPAVPGVNSLPICVVSARLRSKRNCVRLRWRASSVNQQPPRPFLLLVVQIARYCRRRLQRVSGTSSHRVSIRVRRHVLGMSGRHVITGVLVRRPAWCSTTTPELSRSTLSSSLTAHGHTPPSISNASMRPERRVSRSEVLKYQLAMACIKIPIRASCACPSRVGLRTGVSTARAISHPTRLSSKARRTVRSRSPCTPERSVGVRSSVSCLLPSSKGRLTTPVLCSKAAARARWSRSRSSPRAPPTSPVSLARRCSAGRCSVAVAG